MLNNSEIIFVIGKAIKRRQSPSSGEPVRHGPPDGPEVHSDGALQRSILQKSLHRACRGEARINDNLSVDRVLSCDNL